MIHKPPLFQRTFPQHRSGCPIISCLVPSTGGEQQSHEQLLVLCSVQLRHQPNDRRGGLESDRQPPVPRNVQAWVEVQCQHLQSLSRSTAPLRFRSNQRNSDAGSGQIHVGRESHSALPFSVRLTGTLDTSEWERVHGGAACIAESLPRVTAPRKAELWETQPPPSPPRTSEDHATRSHKASDSGLSWISCLASSLPSQLP